MPRLTQQFRCEAIGEPYELELKNGTVVTFRNPNKLHELSAFDVAREPDSEVVLRTLLGGHYEAFWGEFGKRPRDETEAVLNDAMEFYGAPRARVRELAELIDRYGEDIQFDLRHLWGVDLTDWFDPQVGRRPDELHEFISRLPRASRLNTAMSQDVELYRAQTARHGRARNAPQRPEGYDYSPEVEALGAIFYELQQVAYLIANQNAGKKSRRKRFKGVPWPQPMTAREIANREDRKWAFHHLQEIVRYEDDETWQALIEEHQQKPG